jgi:hypothetical protein
MNVPNRGAESRESKDKRKAGGIDLQSAVKVWPTPHLPTAHASDNSETTYLCRAVKKFPMPTARDSKNPGLNFQMDKLSDFPLDQDNPNTNGKNPELWATPEAQNQQGYQIMNGKQYPRLGTQANWATPAATFKGDNLESYEIRQLKVLQTPNNHGKSGITLEAQVNKGKLNPDWVEQLMGLQVGWTDLGCWVTE